jgi:thiol:disulfide interchange protein DsbD
MRNIQKINRSRGYHLFFIVLSLFVFNHSIAFAQFGGEKSHVKIEILSENTSIQAGTPFWIAVRMTMEDDWHTYWKNPGDSGLPTSITWKLPQGFKADPIQWQYPERIVTPPLVSFGYHKTAVLLIRLTPPDNLEADKKVKLEGKISWLECKNVCLPGSKDFSLELPVTGESPKPDSRWMQVFSNARSNLPIADHNWTISAAADKNRLKIQMIAPEWFKGSLKNITFFPFKSGIISYPDEQKLEGSILSIKRPDNAASIDTLQGVLVNPDGWRGPNSEKAILVKVKISEELDSSALPSSGLNSIWLALLFSFLGGMILNLMPCVLPVLSIKILGFVQNAQNKNTTPWKHGILYGIGVLVSFWVLAATLLLLRAGGEQLGWGFQLQSPAFIIILAIFMFIFGLSMFGVFEIGTSLTTIEGKTQRHEGWFGAFLSGVTATVVATPCTAPFMGSALGFALTQPVWVSMLIFTLLGVGMALPFVLFSSIPALLKFIPKPGRWMESLKQFMGFLLAATVIWLLWVLGIQLGVSLVIVILFSLLFVAVGAWIYGRWGALNMPKKTRIRAYIFSALFIITSTSAALQSIDKYGVKQGSALSGAEEGIEWQIFSEQLLDDMLKEGKPVFLDFTAAWCLTCQVNEQVAFSDPAVIEKFKEMDIIAMKADWTSNDEKITKALAKFGRNSVPLYVFYSAADGKPTLLPEIITPDIVLHAIENAE